MNTNVKPLGFEHPPPPHKKKKKKKKPQTTLKEKYQIHFASI